MINTITSAVSKAISTAFPECEIYKEPTEQNALDNSFFIKHEQTVTSGKTSDKREYRHLFVVTYFPPIEGENELMNDVTMKIIPVLETIRINDDWTMHGYSLTCTKEEHLLSVSVEYRTVNVEEAKGEPMETKELSIFAEEK